MENKTRKELVKELWEEGLGVTEISKKLGCSTSNVCVNLDLIFGKDRPKFERFIYRRRVHSIDENYFEKIDTPNKAYFLGLIAADGNVGSKNSKIKLSLHENDRDILESFRIDIKYSKELELLKKKKELGWNRSNQFMINIDCKKLHNDLINCGIIPNKTLLLTFPSKDQVPNDLINHYIRGFFDGDGCIHVQKNNKAGISFANNQIFCNQLRDYFTTIDIKSTVIKHSFNNCYYTRIFTQEDIYKLYKFMYSETDGLVFLKRKKDKFNNWIKKSIEIDNERREKKKIMQFDVNNNFIREWNNSIEAGIFYGNKNISSAIHMCCRGKYLSVYGFKWKYKNNNNNNNN